MRALVLLIPLLGGCTLIFGHEKSDGEGPSCKCDTPPKSYCVDTGTLRSYVANGVCSATACAYAYTNTLCVSGCADGACIGNDPCDGISCNAPPAASCSDASTLETYAISGTCFLGDCSYTSEDQSCPNGCEGTTCSGTAPSCGEFGCLTPPASVCADSTSLTVYGAFGVCENNSCSYSPTLMNCPTGCSNGACNDDGCANVVCIDPPSAVCINSSTLQSYASEGTCNDGQCSYAPTNKTCEYGCSNGACAANLCANVTCPAPGNATATCNQGECSWSCNFPFASCGSSCLADCDVTSPFSFPATGDTLTIANYGEDVIGSRTISALTSVTSISASWTLQNNLASGCSQFYSVYLNNVYVAGITLSGGGSTSETVQMTGTFAAIAGPSYTIEYRPTTSAGIDCGAINFVLDSSTVTIQ